MIRGEDGEPTSASIPRPAAVPPGPTKPGRVGVYQIRQHLLPLKGLESKFEGLL